MKAHRLFTAQKTLALSVAAACAVPLAHAQTSAPGPAATSVTIYGVIDTGIEVVTNVGGNGSIIRMPSITGTLPSRLGFRGTEDLGGGWRALFVIEQGFAPDQGTLNQGGRAFGRQSFVGLAGPWGQVSLGRQYSQIYLSTIGDTLGPNIYGLGSLEAYIPNARVDNSFFYRGTFGGLTVGVTYSLGRDAVASAPAGGCAGETNDGKACRHGSVALQYATPSWGLAGVLDRNYGGAGAGSPLPASSQADTRKLLTGFYRIGDGSLGAGYMRRDNEGLPVVAAGSTARSTLWWLGGNYRVGNFSYDLQYSQLRYANSANGDGARVLAARAMYHFSQRTAAYLTAGRIDNRGTSALSIDGGNVGGSAPLAGGDQSGLMVGLRHSF